MLPDKIDLSFLKYAVENDNYCFFPEDIKYKNMFHYLCHYDYYTLVKLYLEEGNIDINATIETFIFKYSFKLKKIHDIQK